MNSMKDKNKTTLDEENSKVNNEINEEVNDGIRINKFLSESGYTSRRNADKLLDLGQITINDVVATKGMKVSDDDVVKVNGEIVNRKKSHVYLAYNKPKGIETTTNEEVKGNIITALNYKERVFPIGRLDKDSQGLILLTSDGEIVNKILRGSNNHDKEYLVTVNQMITDEFLEGMRNGVPILGTITKKCEVEKINTRTFKIVLTQGLNRQIRRMCDYFGFKVTNLKRVRIMNINLGNLALGEYRNLSPKERLDLNELLKDSKKHFE